MTNQQLKNQNIKKTMTATRERRAGMVCRVFEVKVVAGKFSVEKRMHVNRLFLEAKWLRNATISSEDAFRADRNPSSVQIKCGNHFEDRELLVLGSQMKQDIVDGVKSNIKSLSTNKAKGSKVGRLKCKPYCNLVPLRQYGTTFRIDFDKNLIFIQKMKKPIKVRGLSQIPKNAEIANAKLVRKPSGLYFHITTFCPIIDIPDTGNVVGIDFGIGHNLTLSTGETIDIYIPETKSVKLTSKKLNKSYIKNGRKKTKNHKKRQSKLQAAYEKQSNKKQDMVNKIVADILANNDFIAIQDEMIANWHKGLFGKQVQHSAMGSIKAKLKTSSKTHVVDRSFPSTQKCPICNENTKHPLDKRYYQCNHCGYTHNSRDVKSAAMILMEALNQVCAERTAQSSVEAISSTVQDLFLVSKVAPAKQDAQVL